MASRAYFDRGTWYMKWKPDPFGPWVKEKLCRHPEPYDRGRPPRRPPTQARTMAAELADREDRIRLGLERPAPRKRPLAEYAADYLQAYATKRAKGSLKLARRVMSGFAKFAAERGVADVAGVSRGLVRDYFEARLAEGIQAVTVQNEKGLLGPLFARAVEDGLIAESPLSGLKLGVTAHVRQPTIWTSAELAAIAKAARDQDPVYADVILVLVNTGLRVSAALALEWSWIDSSAGTIAVPKEASKGGKSYTVAISPWVGIILDRRRHELGDRRPAHVFGRGKAYRRISYDMMYAAFGRAIEEAGVRPGHVHDLRHTYARTLCDLGVPQNVVQASLGHATPEMTHRYTAVSGSHAAPYVSGLALGLEKR